MKYFLSLLLTSFLFLAAPGQSLFKAKKPVKTYEESIYKREQILINNPIPFSGIRVIDSRYDTTCIGINVDGYLIPAESGKPLALQQFIDKYFHPLYTAGNDSLLIQFEKLVTQSDLIMEQDFILTAGYISCKLYIGSNNAYKYYDSVTVLISEVYDWETTWRSHKYGRRFSLQNWAWNLLRLCEHLLKRPFIVTGNTAKYFTEEEIRQEGLAKRNKPILKTQNINPGIYRNFSEFVNNEPSSMSENIDSILKLPAIESRRSENGKRVETPGSGYWGYCDGKNVFIRSGNNLYQLERRDGNFYMAATLDALRRQRNREGLNLLIGVTDLGVGIAVKEGVSFKGFNTIKMPKIPSIILSLEGSPVVGILLDWDTGFITN